MRGSLGRIMGRGLVIGLMVVTLPGCGLIRKLFKQDRVSAAPDPRLEETAEEAPVRLVGEVASIHPEEGFVLIHRYAQGKFGMGELISSMGPDGSTAALRLTGEQLGRYFAADIQSGTPKKGDLIIARRLPKSAIAPSTPVQPAPPEIDNAPWMKKSSEP